MVNLLFCLSKKLMDFAVVLGHVVCNERVAAKPYVNGDLTIICSTYRVENELDWKSVQFILTAVVLIICKLFMQYIGK